jgi:hypothetical protein
MEFTMIDPARTARIDAAELMYAAGYLDAEECADYLPEGQDAEEWADGWPTTVARWFRDEAADQAEVVSDIDGSYMWCNVQVGTGQWLDTSRGLMVVYDDGHEAGWCSVAPEVVAEVDKLVESRWSAAR